MANINGGYVMVDFGMTFNEFLTAASTGSFKATKEQFDDLKNAYLSGKAVFLMTPEIDFTIPKLPAMPIPCITQMWYDDDNVIKSYGLLSVPTSSPNGGYGLYDIRVSKDNDDVYIGSITIIAVGS